MPHANGFNDDNVKPRRFADASLSQHILFEHQNQNSKTDSDSNLNLSDIIDDLTKRDYIDKNRQLSPLVLAKDAYLLDTSNITSEDGLKKIIQIISRKLEK